MLTTDQTTPTVPTDDAGAPPLGRWAMGHFPSHMRLWLVTVLGLAADLWTKHWAFSELKMREPRVVIENFCSLELSLNPGALFGFGAGLAPIFVGASVLALLFVLYLFANSRATRWSMHIALGLVLGGALGNLYDRTTQQGYVVKAEMRPGGSIGRDIGIVVDETDTHITLDDFPSGGGHLRAYAKKSLLADSGPQPVVRDFIKIEAKLGDVSIWPWVFNIADALLVVGVAMLLINFWTDRGHHQAEPESEAETPNPST